MNTVNIDDQNFISTETYQNFMRNNPEYGYLRIRAYAASQAVPISGLKVVVSKIIDNTKVIFFEGETDSSGMIREISLPAPRKNTDNLETPQFTTYRINATYSPDNMSSVYNVNIYDDIIVVQSIVVVPDMNLMNRSDYYGY